MNNSSPPGFPSLAALRAAHNGLLQAHRDQGDTPALLAEVGQFLQQGRATGAILDTEQERWTAQSLLDYWTATLLSAGHQPADALLAEFDPTLAPTLPDDLCPYVGLDAFHEDKNDVFFGRQRLAQLLIDKLKESRLLAVVGPSGSGKSSLVLGGLIPALKQGAIPATEARPGSDQWRYAPRMVPGSDPLANLARILQSAGVDVSGAEVTKSQAWIGEQVAHLKQDAHHLAEMVSATGNTPAVLVVDQFEELFTLCADEATRQAFANNLLTLTQAPDQRHTVILTLRTDFESFIMRLPGFQPFFEQALVRVTPLNAAELREAIEKPAELVGLKFEEGIVDALLQDILGEPAALPLLQFSLLKLWEHRERNRITWEAYRRLGGGRLALARSADDLYDSLIPEEQVTARRILLRLVRPGEGLEVTSNRVRRDTLYQTGEARDRIDRVLKRLIDARLLRVSEGDTSADMQIEVAHEALVRNWPRLVEWLDEERERIRERLTLTAAAEQWEKVGRDSGALLRGALLDEALRFDDLNELEAEYVRASQDAALAVEREQEAVRQRELAQARALAEEQRQRADSEQKWGAFQAQAATRLRQRAVSLTVLTVIALLLAAAAGVFGFQWNQNAIIASNERAIAVGASTEAAQQAIAAATAEAVAVAQAATAEAARAFAIQQAEAAQTAEAAARENEQRAQFALGAVQAAMQELQRILTPQPTAIPLLETPTPPPTPIADAPSTPTSAEAIVDMTPSATGVLTTTPEFAPSIDLIMGEDVTGTHQLTIAIAGATGGISLTSELFAILPDIDVSLFEQPDPNTSVLATLRAPNLVPVLEATPEWIKVAAQDGQVGWLRAWLVTYAGAAERLPAELRYLVVTDQDDVPFTYGTVSSFGGAEGDFLLKDPNDEQSGILWVPVGTEVTLLFPRDGVTTYGSGAWYFVTLVDPGGENQVWFGYLPAEVIAAR